MNDPGNHRIRHQHAAVGRRPEDARRKIKKPSPAKPQLQEFRDRVAVQVACICMGDLSRQLSGGMMPIADAEQAISFIAALSYRMADALLEAREMAAPK